MPTAAPALPIHSIHPHVLPPVPSHHTSHQINESTRRACACCTVLAFTPHHVSSCPVLALTRPRPRHRPAFQPRASRASDRQTRVLRQRTIRNHRPALVTQTYVCALSTSSHSSFRIDASTSRHPSLAPLPLTLGSQSRAVLTFDRALQLSNEPRRTQATTASPPPLGRRSRVPALQPGFLNPLP